STTYTLSLHDALPICQLDIIIISLDLPRDLVALLHLFDGKRALYFGGLGSVVQIVEEQVDIAWLRRRSVHEGIESPVCQLSLARSEEHTSELQSLRHL